MLLSVFSLIDRLAIYFLPDFPCESYNVLKFQLNILNIKTQRFSRDFEYSCTVIDGTKMIQTPHEIENQTTNDWNRGGWMSCAISGVQAVKKQI